MLTMILLTILPALISPAPAPAAPPAHKSVPVCEVRDLVQGRGSVRICG